MKLTLIFVILTNLAFATNYYVSTSGSDSNAGTSAGAAWATINHANSVVVPGDVVNVAAGSYHQNISTTTSGTLGSPITYISTLQFGAQITGTTDPTWSNTGGYVIIKNFDITSSVPTVNAGVETTGTYSQIVSNRVHDIQDSDRAGGGAIWVGAAHVTVDSNIIYNVGIGLTTALTHGVYVSGTTYTLVENNLIIAVQGGYGIQEYDNGAGYMTAVNNTIVASHGGIVLGSGNPDNPSDYNFISNNIIYSNTSNGGGYGILECCASGEVGPHQTYTNNLLYANTPSNLSLAYSGDSPVNEVMASPLFVNYTGNQAGDYQLQAGSPAINAGTSINAPNHDILGVLRPQGSAYDIGAYEFGSPQAPTGLKAVVK
jgi:hypothetical protein